MFQSRNYPAVSAHTSLSIMARADCLQMVVGYLGTSLSATLRLVLSRRSPQGGLRVRFRRRITPTGLCYTEETNDLSIDTTELIHTTRRLLYNTPLSTFPRRRLFGRRLPRRRFVLFVPAWLSLA
jgi:hypothetical protein